MPAVARTWLSAVESLPPSGGADRCTCAGFLEGEHRIQPDSQPPCHALARAVGGPLRMVFSALACQRSLLQEKSMASASVFPKLAALSFAHSRLAATHLCMHWTTLLVSPPPTTQMTSSTKGMPQLFFDLVLQRSINFRDVNCKEDWRDRGTLGGRW